MTSSRWVTKQEYYLQREVMESRGLVLGEPDFVLNNTQDQDETIDTSLSERLDELFRNFMQTVRVDSRFRGRDPPVFKDYR